MPFRFTRGFASMKVNERMPMANITAKVFFLVKQCIFLKKDSQSENEIRCLCGFSLYVMPKTSSPVHLIWELVSLLLILSYFFFKNAKTNYNWWSDYVLRKMWLNLILLTFCKKKLCSQKHKFRIILILYFNFFLHKYFLQKVKV